MTTFARLIALIVATNFLLLVAMLLGAMGQHATAAAVATATAAGFVGGLVIAARSVPHQRIRSVNENVRIGVSLAVMSASLGLMAIAILAAAGDVRIPAIFAVTGAVLALIAAGMLNAARMLRLVTTLISREEQPHAIALGANAMPSMTPRVVVATNNRIVWAEGRGLRNRHALAFDDVRRFEADYSANRLTVIGDGAAFCVAPVPKRELEKFDDLLRGSRSSRAAQRPS